MTFYNTLGLSQVQVQIAKVKINNQEDIILEYFRVHAGSTFSPTEIHDAFPHWPLTSIRRSITDLTVAGLLEKTDIQRMGKYGMPNYCWKLKERAGEIAERLF